MTVAELHMPLKSTTTGVVFRNILLATDFSEPSRRALCEALALAAQHHAQLSVIHVLHPHRRRGDFENPPEVDGDRIAAEKQIKELLHELRPQDKIGVLIKQGDAALQVGPVI